MNNWREKKVQIVLAVLILLFVVALRLNAPTADLPSHITFSGSILTDEGNQCHNSRSKALYDEWYPDDWRISNYNPILPYIKYGIFKSMGVGLFQMRLFSHIFAALSLLFFFLTLKSYSASGYRWALLGTLLLGTNFLFIMYNKIGTFETSITFWVILTLYFMEKYRDKQKTAFLLLAGSAAFMTFVFKSIMAYILPLPYVACMLICMFPKDGERRSVSRIALNLLAVTAGVVLVAAPWYFLHYLPNKEWIVSAPGKYMGNLMLPRTMDAVLQNILTFPWKDQLYKIPVVWLGAVLYVPFFARRVVKRKADLTEAAVTLFFLAHTAVFFVMSYRPTRYFVPVIPVMVFMTVILLKRFSTDKRDENATPYMTPLPEGFLYLADTLWLTIAVYYCFIPLISSYIYPLPFPPMSYLYPACAAGVMGIFYIVKRFYKKLVWRRPNFLIVSVPVTIIMLAFSFYIDMSYYLDWNNTKTFYIRDMSVEMRDKLEDAYIAGMTAPVAVMENKHKALWLYPNFVNWDEQTFTKYPLTHALLGTDVSHEIIHFFHKWPQRMGNAEILKVYHIKDYFLHLYSFQTPYITEGVLKRPEPSPPAKSRNRQGTKQTETPAAPETVFLLTVMNPSAKTIQVRIGQIHFAEQVQGDTDTTALPKFDIRKGDRVYPLAPGETKLLITVKEETLINAASVLLFLEYDRAYRQGPLRYEAENFSSKTGEVVRALTASNNYSRRFVAGGHTPGFLAYGPAVPYADGLLIADFKLSIENTRTKIRPVCQLDIFSQEDKKPVAAATLKPADIKNSRNGTYRLAALLPSVKTLEFRVKVDEWADVDYDYMDLTYYKGVMVDVKTAKTVKTETTETTEKKLKNVK